MTDPSVRQSEVGPPDPAPPPGRRRAFLPWVAWPIVLLATSAAFVFPAMMLDPPEWDTCLFKWFGKRMLQGDRLYLDIWDHKLPVIFWINELAAMLGDQQTVLYLLESLSVAASAWMLCLMIRRHVGSWSVAGLTGLGYVTLASARATIEKGNLTEHWAAPFVVLCIYAAVRAVTAGASPDKPGDGKRDRWAWPILSGFALGMATCLRPPSLVIGAALLLLLPSLKRAGRSAAGTMLRWSAGFAIIPAVVFTWAAARGLLEPLWSSGVVFNVAYGSHPPPWATWGQVARDVLALVQHTWLWHVLGLYGLTVIVFECLAGKTARPRPRGAIPIKALAVAWLLTALVSACSTRLPHVDHYYYLVLMPVAMLSGWAWRSVTDPIRRSWKLAVVCGPILAAILLWMGCRLVVDYREADRCRRDAACVAEAAGYLAEHGQPTDTLYVFPLGVEADIAARLGWRCPTRHFYAFSYPHMPDALAPGGLMEQWRDDMLRSPPDWLVGSDRDDLKAGKVQLLVGWGTFAKAVQLGGDVSEVYRDLYDEKKRFSSGPDPDHPSHCVIIYQRKPQTKIKTKTKTESASRTND